MGNRPNTKQSNANPLLDIKARATYLYLEKIRLYYYQNQDLINKNPQKPYDGLLKVMNQILFLSPQTDTNTLYRAFHEALEKVAKYELQPGAKLALNLDPLFIEAYENNSEINAIIYDEILHEAENKNKIEKKVKTKTTDPDKIIDVRHPDNKANAFFTSMLGVGYHPLKRNNVPYVAFDAKQVNTGRTCLRMGAQTQKNGKVNPSFKRYLLANSRNSSPGNIDYVYINLLKRKPGSQHTDKNQVIEKKGFAKKIEKFKDKFVRYSEGKRASALERLNYSKELKTAVITLPADSHFFLGRFSMKTGGVKGTNSSIPYDTLFESINQSILKNQNDFFITENVKTRLFGENRDNGELEKLFKQAVTDVMGAPKHASGTYPPFTAEQRSAILFQFVKFNLSNYILDTLNPKAYNFSCKDGIDRGAIHTLWFHMNQLHDLHQKDSSIPAMTQETFMKHLDSPALIVKYRPLNHNRNLIWNALNHRMKADQDFAHNHPWAVDWLKHNAPAGAEQTLRKPITFSAPDHPTDPKKLPDSPGLPARQAKPLPKPKP